MRSSFFLHRVLAVSPQNSVGAQVHKLSAHGGQEQRDLSVVWELYQGERCGPTASLLAGLLQRQLAVRQDGR